MWRANPGHSKEITLRQIVYDEQGENPEWTDQTVTAEVYPCTDPLERQAMGITKEAACTLIMGKGAVTEDTVIILEDKAYKAVSVAEYEPLQVVAVFTGQTIEQYMQSLGG